RQNKRQEIKKSIFVYYELNPNFSRDNICQKTSRKSVRKIFFKEGVGYIYKYVPFGVLLNKLVHNSKSGKQILTLNNGKPVTITAKMVIKIMYYIISETICLQQSN